jgi:hypothetical protein
MRVDLNPTIVMSITGCCAEASLDWKEHYGKIEQVATGSTGRFLQQRERRPRWTVARLVAGMRGIQPEGI